MQEVLIKVSIGLQISAIIPVLVILYYRPVLNLFFKVLFASVLLSLFFDAIGVYYFFAQKNNLSLYSTYYILNAILLTYLWEKIPFYSSKYKKFVIISGSIIVSAMILFGIYYSFNREAYQIISCLSVLLGLTCALQYYYQKIEITSYTPLLKDPYFITASGYILFSLSTIVILAAQSQFKSEPDLIYTWTFRQIFYMIFMIILAYAFYVLHIIQVKEK